MQANKQGLLQAFHRHAPLRGPEKGKLLTKNSIIQMHGHPTLGVTGAKPRLSSHPGPEIGKLSEEYLTVRNQQMRTKNLTAEMQLAERRGELIEKRLVENQAAYLLVAMRQAALNIPQAYCRRILNIAEPRQAKEI